MAINQVFSIRGATTVEVNTQKEITEKSVELITNIFNVNNLNDKHFDVVNITATTTADVTAFYPVRAIRECGITTAPLFSCLEPPIDNSLRLCIRLILTVASSKDSIVAAKHVYLHGATQLRKDIVLEDNK